MKLTAVGFAALTSFLLNISRVQAQGGADHSIQNIALENSINQYRKFAKEQPPYFNGSIYGYAYRFKSGFPSFLSPEFINGTLVYDSITYFNVPLLYDELQLAIITQVGALPIELNRNKVQSFTLSEHSFIKLSKDSGATNEPGPGFYEVLYSGRISALKKETKKVNEQVLAEGIERTISTSSNYYIRKGNHFYNIHGKDDLLDAFADKKQELKMFLRKQNLKFNKNRDEMIARSAEWYDQATK